MMAKLNSRHRNTLAKLFTRPNRADIPWRDVVNLFEALGAEVEQRRGSRVSVTLAGRVNVFTSRIPSG